MSDCSSQIAGDASSKDCPAGVPNPESVVLGLAPRSGTTNLRPPSICNLQSLI